MVLEPQSGPLFLVLFQKDVLDQISRQVLDGGIKPASRAVDGRPVRGARRLAILALQAPGLDLAGGREVERLGEGAEGCRSRARWPTGLPFPPSTQSTSLGPSCRQADKKHSTLTPNPQATKAPLTMSSLSEHSSRSHMTSRLPRLVRLFSLLYCPTLHERADEQRGVVGAQQATSGGLMLLCRRGTEPVRSRQQRGSQPSWELKEWDAHHWLCSTRCQGGVLARYLSATMSSRS